jgi:ribosomal protein S21
MMEVTVDGNLSKAISILKKSIERDGIFREIKLRSIASHSERVRQKKRLAFARALKKQRKVQTLIKKFGHAYDDQY